MLALPTEVEHWSLTTLRENLVKIGAKVINHGRYVTFQLGGAHGDGRPPHPAPAGFFFGEPSFLR